MAVDRRAKDEVQAPSLNNIINLLFLICETDFFRSRLGGAPAILLGSDAFSSGFFNCAGEDEEAEGTAVAKEGLLLFRVGGPPTRRPSSFSLSESDEDEDEEIADRF